MPDNADFVWTRDFELFSGPTGSDLDWPSSTNLESYNQIVPMSSESSPQGATAFEQQSRATHQAHPSSQHSTTPPPSFSTQQASMPGPHQLPFQVTVKDFDDFVGWPNEAQWGPDETSTHPGFTGAQPAAFQDELTEPMRYSYQQSSFNSTEHDSPHWFDQMDRELTRMTPNTPPLQGSNHVQMRQRAPSEPWTPFAMGHPSNTAFRYCGSLTSMQKSSSEGLDGGPFTASFATNITTPGTSPKSGAGLIGSTGIWHQQSTDHQLYARYPNGSVSAESYCGMSIDSIPDGHRRQSASMSRTSSQRLSVHDAPSSPTLTITPDFVEECLACKQDGCNETFTGAFRRGNLSRHIRIVHGRKVYPCGIHGCKRTFKRSDARLKHQRKHHPDLGLPGPLPRR